VNVVAAAPALIAGLFLFLVPGFVLLALLPKEDRLPFDESLFFAVSVSVAAAAWVALLLAEAGRFSLVRGGLVLGVASGVLALAGRRRLGWPIPLPKGPSEVLPATLILLLALVLQARPSEYIVGGRDPGTYVAAMGLIARSGGLVYPDPVVLSVPREDLELFFRNPEKADYSWVRFMGFPLERPETGRVVPENFHLFPAFGAYLCQALGVKGALATPPVFGVLGTLAVFFALRRILGPHEALLASLMLCLNVVQVWFARYPVSEMVSQFLIFLGLWAFRIWEERRAAAFGVLGGAALGLSLLVRIDSVLVVVPLGAYLLLRRFEGDLDWRDARDFLVPFLLLALHGTYHAAFFSWKYVRDIVTRRYWRHSPILLAAAVGLAALVVLILRHFRRRILDHRAGHGKALRTTLAAGITLLCLYSYFLRPALSAWAGGDGNLAAPLGRGPVLRILKAAGFHRLAAHDAQSFLRLGWFLSPLGLLLGVAACWLLLLKWRRAYLLFLLTTLTFSAFYFYKIRIWNDYFFALRRFVPVVIPAILGLVAFLLVFLARLGRLQRALSGCLALGLLVSYARGTAPIFAHTDWKNSVGFVSGVARRFGPRDIVIFEQKGAGSLHLISLPLWALYGVNVLELARYDPDRDCPGCLQRLIQSWRGRYQNIYFVRTYRTNLCGLFVERVPSPDYRFETVEWERGYVTPPRAPERKLVSFTVSRVVLPSDLSVPALPEVDIGGSDDLQISGFFEKEGGGERTYRWIAGSGREACGAIYFPGAKAGARLAITASAGKRPPTKPATVRVSLSGVALGSFVAGPDWEDFALQLPEALPEGPSVLRLDVSTWRPGKEIPGSDDFRDLGIMVDRIRLVEAPVSRTPGVVR